MENPLTSLLRLGAWPHEQPLHFFFVCFALFLIYFWVDGKETPSPSYSSNCIRPGSSWRSKWKRFPVSRIHPSGSHSGVEDFWQGKGVFRSHQNKLPGKKESLSHHSSALPLSTISQWKCWFSLLVSVRVRARDGEGTGGRSTGVTRSHYTPV